MAKSKNKPLKRYKVPPEKFLVVVDAWGLVGDFVQSDFNQISAWFEIMLEEAYPKSRVSSIYYQRTHRNIIVELPRQVTDINQYLGAHYYSKFLTHDTDAHRQVLIYEYKYALFGDPAEKNWSVGYPNYSSIPADIPIRRPFPLLPFPPPQPTSDIPYACQVPVDVVAANEKKHLQALKAAETTPSCSSSTSVPRSFERLQPRNNESTSVPSSPRSHTNEGLRPSSNHRSIEIPHARDKGKSSTVEVPPPPTGAFTPYVAPSHLTSHLKQSMHVPSYDQITKRDPYEEEEESRNLLRSTRSVKLEEADDFIGSFLPTVKREEEICIKPEDEEDYKPSAELLAALNTLPPELLDDRMEVAEEEEESKPFVKPEPIEHEIGAYHPSDELLAALAELPSGLRPEQEVDDYQPSDELLAELAALPPELLPHEYTPVKREPNASQAARSEFIPRVKEEPMDDVLPYPFHRSGQSSSHVQVKSEPVDERYRLPSPQRSLPRQVDYDASRDPRLKRLDVQRKNSGDKRDGDHLSHIKSEPVDDRYGLPPPPSRSLPRPADDASRDPRLKRLDLQRKNSGDKRDGDHLSHPHANTSKRVKREYLE